MLRWRRGVRAGFAMLTLFSDTEILVRLGCFFCVLLAMAAAELLAPRRPLAVSKPKRWAGNFGLALLNTVVARLLLPLGAVGVALVAREQGWGLFNAVPRPEWLAVVLSVLAL